MMWTIPGVCDRNYYYCQIKNGSEEKIIRGQVWNTRVQPDYRISVRCPGVGPVGLCPGLNSASGSSRSPGIVITALLLVALLCVGAIVYIETRGPSHHHDDHTWQKHHTLSTSGRRFPVAMATDLNDPTLHYGIVVDCGSSGSRVYVYYWPPHTGNSGELLNIHQVRDKNANLVVKKIEPGISEYADKPSEASDYIRPLLEYAAKFVPSKKHKETPLYILATAGMRMLSERDQNAILEDLRVDVPLEFGFHFQQTHAEVISGKQEGVYAWVAINYVLGKFDHDLGDDTLHVVEVPGKAEDRTHIRKRTVGMIDMGGGSAQMAYEVPKSVRFESPKEEVAKSLLAEFNLGCTDSDMDHTYRVYVSTFLGFGGNEARRRYEKKLIHSAMIQGYISTNSSIDYGVQGASESTAIADPCLPRDMVDSVEYGGSATYLRGTGDFAHCYESLRPLLNTTSPCMKQPCSMNGVFQPDINFYNSEFFGFSEFYYTTEDVLRMSGPYDYLNFQRAAKEYCHTPWTTLQSWYEKKLYPKADKNRFKYQCFKSAWMTSVLHEGFNFPRQYKHFTTAQLVNGRDAQWTLGALLYKTRFFPLTEIQQHYSSHHSRQSWWSRPLQYATYPFLICVSFVIAAIVIYLRRLRIVQSADLRKIPSMVFLLTEQEQEEEGILVRNVYP